MKLFFFLTALRTHSVFTVLVGNKMLCKCEPIFKMFETHQRMRHSCIALLGVTYMSLQDISLENISTVNSTKEACQSWMNQAFKTFG